MPAHTSDISDVRRGRPTAIVGAVSVALLAAIVLFWRSDEANDYVWFRLAACTLLVPLVVLLIRLLFEQVQRLAHREGRDASDSLPFYSLPSRPWLVAALVLGVCSSIVVCSPNPVTSFVVFVCALPFLLLVVAPLLALLFVGPILQRALPRLAAHIRLSAIVRGLLLLFMFGIAHLPGACVRQFQLYAEAKRAKTWCEALVPRIEAWRAEHGVYPSSLDELDSGITAPTLSYSTYVEYHRRNDGIYWFGVADPDGGLWMFDGGSHEWRLSD
jgi:hypothetical protein